MVLRRQSESQPQAPDDATITAVRQDRKVGKKAVEPAKSFNAFG